MRYVSTRGSAPAQTFSEVLVGGLAPDGGLYVPDAWPVLDPSLLSAGRDRPYVELAAEVIAPFMEGCAGRADLVDTATAAYEMFDDPQVTPLCDIGDGVYLLELFHGPTLAFKDIALQLTGRLLEAELARRGEQVTIVSATSGDTGAAAIAACADREGIEIFVLHPAGRISAVQRRQMTTVTAANVHNLAIDGTFDDCQDLVKALFADADVRDRLRLAAANSINWSRVMAQIVYYAVAVARLGGGPAAFAVPTGNFGNVFAGYVARQMGVPATQLVVGSNRNDILTRFFHTGALEIRDVHATLSPSMDIQVSSNFERLLFELYDRDGTETARACTRFRETGAATVGADRLARALEVFAAECFDDEDTIRVIAEVYDRTGALIDPHTAVGLAAGEARRADPDIPLIALSTAHPAKFPDAIEAATGERLELPEPWTDLAERPEHCSSLPNDLTAVREHLLDQAVLAGAGA